MGRASAAEEMYKKALAQRPEYANFYDAYAFFLFNAGRTKEAAANFLRETQLMPTPRGFNNLGGAYQAMGDATAAKPAYEKSTSIGPTAASACAILSRTALPMPPNRPMERQSPVPTKSNTESGKLRSMSAVCGG